MNRIDIEAANVKSVLSDILAAYPEIVEDEQLALDTFEGETNLFEIASYVVKEKCACDAYSDGLKEWMSQIGERKARFDRKSDGYRKLLQSLMEAAKVDKLPLPEATISRTKGRTKAVVDDVNDLTQGYYKTERKPDLATIKKDLESGLEVHGAHLETGSDTISIRTK